MAGRLASDAIGATFPPQARVRAKADFDRVFAHGRRVATPVLALHFLADDAPARLGLAVSRKVDRRAVARNRIKRRLRDHFRRHRATLAAGAYVVVARSGAASASGPELIAAFDLALRRSGALPPAVANGTMPRARNTPSSLPPTDASAPPATSPDV